jgi:hypothetical protein
MTQPPDYSQVGPDEVEAYIAALYLADARHLIDVHHAEPGRLARDTPTLDQVQDLHDVAHRYPGAPWGELIMRARAEAQYAEWDRRYRDRPEILEEIGRFRAEAGDLDAAHPVFLGFLERRIAERLRARRGLPGPAAAAAGVPWLAGISFPGPVQPSPTQLSGRKASRTPPPPGRRAAWRWRLAPGTGHAIRGDSA